MLRITNKRDNPNVDLNILNWKQRNFSILINKIMDSEQVSALFSKLWTKKRVPVVPSVKRMPPPEEVPLSTQEADKVTAVLESIRPVMEFIYNPDREKMIGFIPYATAVIIVLGLAGLVFNRRWKKGTLDKFVGDQYRDLIQWSRKKYLVIEREKTQRELERRKLSQERRKKEKAEEEEYKRQQATQSWMSYFKDKLASTAPHNMIRNLLDPTNQYSWGLLGSMWVQYMTGTHLPYVGSQLPFGAVATATAAKILVFTGYMAKKLIRREIYGDEYDPLIIRLPNALMISFLNLLHRRLTKKQILGPDDEQTDDQELNTLRKEIAALRTVQDGMSENIKELTKEDISNPRRLAESVETIRMTQTDLESRKETLVKTLNELSEPSKIIIRPLIETQFSGGVEKSSMWSVWFESSDSIFTNTWISLAEHLIDYSITKEDVTRVMMEIGMTVDKDNVKNVNPWTTNAWSRFKMTLDTESKGWETKRDELLALKKFITTYLLNPSAKIVETVQSLEHHKWAFHQTMGVPTSVLMYVKTHLRNGDNKDDKEGDKEGDNKDDDKMLDSTSIKWEWFLTANDIKRLDVAKKSLDIDSSDMSIEERNKTVQTQLERVDQTLNEVIQESKKARSVYVSTVRKVYRRHLDSIALCKTACQLVKYYMAVKDAFDISTRLYSLNLKLEFPDSFWEDSTRFLKMHKVYDAMIGGESLPYGISTLEVKYVTYEDAMKNVYDKIDQKKSYQSDLLRTLMSEMCPVYHLTHQLDNLHPDKTISIHADLRKIHTLYHVQDRCELTSGCKDCECETVSEQPNMLKIPNPPSRSQTSPRKKSLQYLNK
jgi:hypothetical protein